MSDGDNATPGRPGSCDARTAGRRQSMAYPISAADTRRRAVGARTNPDDAEPDEDADAHARRAATPTGSPSPT